MRSRTWCAFGRSPYRGFQTVHRPNDLCLHTKGDPFGENCEPRRHGLRVVEGCRLLERLGVPDPWHHELSHFTTIVNDAT